MLKPLLLDLDKPALCQLAEEFHEPKYRAKQLCKRVLCGAKISEMQELPATFRAELSARYDDEPLTVIKTLKAGDGSEKYLFKLRDGEVIEGVFMRQHYGTTLCLSTQSGCRMGCAFCASTLNGLNRNLTSGEMMAQVFAVERLYAGGAERAVKNIVLMGSGEPFDNYENVAAFIRAVTDVDGINMGGRNLTVSTCGLPDGIRRLSDDGFTAMLSISLHAPTDEKRRAIMPIAKRYTIAETLSAAKYYFEKTGRRVCYEYAMIDGFNVSDEDAKNLASLTHDFPVYVNLIPLNDVPERKLKGASKPACDHFFHTLKDLGVNASTRYSKATDVGGACGQLRNKFVGDLKGKK